MRQLKSVFFLLALGVISVLAVLAQDSPTPTITPPITNPEVTLPPEPPTLEVTLTPSLTPTPDLATTSTPETNTSTPTPSGPYKLRLLSPSPKAQLTSEEAVFSWSELPGAVSYRFKLFNAKTGKVLVNSPLTADDYSCDDQVCTLQLANLGFSIKEDRSYRWQIIALVSSDRLMSGQRLFTTVKTSKDKRATLLPFPTAISTATPIPTATQTPSPYMFSPNEVIVFVGQITVNNVPRNTVNIYDGYNQQRSEVIRETDAVLTHDKTIKTITQLGNAAYLSYNGKILLFLCYLDGSATPQICLADIIDAGNGQSPRFTAINRRSVTNTNVDKVLGGWAPQALNFTYWEEGSGNFLYRTVTDVTQKLTLNQKSLRWEQDGKLYFTKNTMFSYLRDITNGPNRGLFQYYPSNGSETRILDPNTYPIYTSCYGLMLYPVITMSQAHSNFAVSPQGDVIAYLGHAGARINCYVNRDGLNSFRTWLETVVKYSGQNPKHGDSAFGNMGPYSIEWSPTSPKRLAVASGNTIRILYMGDVTPIRFYPVNYTLQDKDAILLEGISISRTNPLHWMVIPSWAIATPTPSLTPTYTATPPYCDELTPTATWEMPTEEPIGTPVVNPNPTLCGGPGVVCPDPTQPGEIMRAGQTRAMRSIDGDMCIVRPTATPSATPTVTPTATETPDPQQAYYKQFTGIMFWAIYNETNRNQTVNRPDITNDVNDAMFVYHGDHRYLMARTMLNNIPLNDITAGVAYMKRWKGSIGDSQYDMWGYQKERGVVCIYNGDPIGTYDAKTSAQTILEWFNGYASCLQNGGALEGFIGNFDEAYNTIESQINEAIKHHVSGVSNPVAGKGYIKTTSRCYVFEVVNGLRQSCRATIDMDEFCKQMPSGYSSGDRNCQESGTYNPANLKASDWLKTVEAKEATQQLNLSTTVGTAYEINMGLYTPDSPPEALNSRHFFLMRETIKTGNLVNETEQVAWLRHKTRMLQEPTQYYPNYGSVYAHTLRQEAYAKTWVTYVYQNDQ